MIDVLISGAGASGLTLAIELARRGVAFRLVDRLEVPFAGSRGKGIQPRTLEVFEDLGIVDRIAAAGAAYPPQRHHRPDGSFHDEQTMIPDAPNVSEPYRMPLLVPQWRTETVLRERLCELGAVPDYGYDLLGFEQDAECVTARIVGPDGVQTVACRYLVGADGGRSFVRHALRLGFPGETLGVRAIVADVTLDGLTRDAWHRYNGENPERQISFCPLPHSNLFQIQGPVPDEWEMDLSAGGLQAFIDARLPSGKIVLRDVAWASDYRMNARLADRYRVGRVLLVGDAAHIHPPTGGQGLNTSVQDAYNLGWKLAGVLSGAPDGLLDSYETERRPIAAGMLGLATNLLQKARQGDLRRGREAHQLDLGYQNSPLSQDASRPDAIVNPGDRAPDALIRGAGGQPRRLFDLFQGTHWTLLGYEVKDIAIKARKGLHIHMIGTHGSLCDEDGHFCATYGLEPGDCVLVRPDGYIAATVTSGNTGMLEATLGSLGINTGHRLAD